MSAETARRIRASIGNAEEKIMSTRKPRRGESTKRKEEIAAPESTRSVAHGKKGTPRGASNAPKWKGGGKKGEGER